MVEEDAGAAEHAIRLTVFLHNPKAVELGDGIGTVRMERCILVLRHFFHLAIKFRSRSLIDLTRLLQMVGSYGFEHSENAHSIDICRKLWGIEADLNVALSCQIVYLCRLHQADQLDEGHRVAHVGIVKMEMRLAFQMSDAFTEVN